jgi:hypothetical protein
MHDWIAAQVKSFFEGIRKLVQWWTKCNEKQGDYVEKLCQCNFSICIQIKFITKLRIFIFVGCILLRCIIALSKYTCNRKCNYCYFILVFHNMFRPSSGGILHQSHFWSAVNTTTDPLFLYCLPMWYKLFSTYLQFNIIWTEIKLKLKLIIARYYLLLYVKCVNANIYNLY